MVNFPKIHLSKGAEKNSSCDQLYKPNIRVIKNARNRAKNDFPVLLPRMSALQRAEPDIYYQLLRYILRGADVPKQRKKMTAQ